MKGAVLVVKLYVFVLFLVFVQMFRGSWRL